MYDGGKVIIGIVIAIILVTFPMWYNLAEDAKATFPELAPARDTIPGTVCVADTIWMRGRHMDLLNDWRDQVVRQDERFFQLPLDVRREKSLSNTCLGCHAEKDKFCDRCHTFMGVDPYCWDCHVVPEEIK